jgi:signal transduction histidine kinase
MALFLGIQWLLHAIQRWHLNSVLREREQLAFEMHDTLAQSFTGIAYQLQAATLETRVTQPGLPFR